jgi:hypothetical protein
MNAIRAAKDKFAKEKKLADEKINENFMASDLAAHRIPASEEANELLSNKEKYTIWLYHNIIAMFRPGQQAAIHNLLVGKLQEGMDWKDLSPKTFEVQIF